MKNNVFNILKKELRETFRDKKSLTMMLIIPIMIPLLVIGISALFESEINKPVTEYNKIGFDYELNDVEKKIIKDLEIDPVNKSRKSLQKEYEEEKIDLYITKDNNQYVIHGTNNDTTAYATTLAEGYFSAYKEYLQKEYLEKGDIPVDDITLKKDIVEKENFYANYITSYAFLFIIMAITISATYPATDATAGERERGTLETLLTFPIKSRDIIVGKFLSVSFSSIVTGMISLILMVISLIVANQSFDIYKDVNLMLSPASFVFATIVIGAYSFLISGLCIAIASKSKSFKEAQSALTPLTFISFFPSFIAFMMELKIGVVSSLIPFLNFTLLFTDIVNGNFNLLYVLLVVLSTAITIFLVLKIIISQYKSEKVLFVN